MLRLITQIILLLCGVQLIWAQCIVNDDNEMECNKVNDALNVPMQSPTPALSDSHPPSFVTITGSTFKSLSKKVLRPIASMEVLYIIGNTIENIEPDAFSEFTNLKELMLTQNKITHLENWTEELKGIDVLIFEDNIIENRDHFIPLINRKIKNVERLHLGNNGIKSLNWLNFECHRLLVLSLTKNYIRTLPKNLSSHLRFLKYLDLQYNLLTKIDNTMFKGFSRLIDLRLAHNNISEIADGAFMDLSNLISLTFRNNSIATITANTFVGLSSLKTLSLTENRLDQISSDAFQATPALENLHLFENTLTSIEIGTFKNLNGLLDLELSNNYITLLNPGVFENLENLTKIKMARNNLEVLKTNSFVNMPKLRLVNIAYNNIKVIEDNAFLSIPHLHEVNLMHNEISVWNPRAFKNIAKIGKINLEGNQLKTIQSQAFHNLNVKFIDFKDNLITKIEVDGFQGLDSLEYLGLSGNSIEELSKEIFNHLGNLKCIDFVNNKVQKTELLQQLPKVQFIFTESDGKKRCLSKANFQ